jgi:hypothetical protein
MAASRERTTVEPDPSRGEPARAAPARAKGERLPRSVATLSGALVFLLASGLMVSAFDPDLAGESQSLLFWSGLALAISASTAVGIRPGARESERVLALAGLAALLYLPYVLRSPEQPLFAEALDHRQAFRLIIASGHVNLPGPLDLVEHFPGLELAASWLHGATGISLPSLARLLPLVLNVTVPVLVFGVAAALGLSGRTAFLAGMLVMGHKAFFFFHSAFTPEILGIACFLGVWALVAMAGRDRLPSWGWAVPLGTLIAAAVVIQHLSALLIGLGLLLLAGVLSWRNERTAVDVFVLGAGTILLLATWLVIHVSTTPGYLSAIFTSRIGWLVEVLRGEGDGIREIYGQQTPPAGERVVAWIQPVLLTLLCAGGLVVALRRRPLGALLLTLLVFTVLWVISTPVLLAGGSALVFRLWPFLFLGVAIYAALGFRHLERLRRVPAAVRRGAVVAAVVLVIAGGIVLGDNEAGRFPRPAAATAAGPDAVSDDAIAAARWLSLNTGRNHRILADKGTGAVFSAFGDQRPVTRGAWLPFAAATPQEMARRLRRRRAPYVVVDSDITRLPPRYGYYFSPEERLPQPFPATLLRRLDQVATRSRIYDNGEIAIYGPAGVAR